MKKFLLPILFISFVIILSACEIHVPSSRYGLRTGEVIILFEPDRGRNSNYVIGDRIRFRIRTNQTGYITLTAIDPDGSIYVLSRNVYVRSGITTTIPTADMRVQFRASTPTGLHRVRASFTPRPTDVRHVVYQDTYGVDVWTKSIVTEIEPYPENSRDIVETNLYINHGRGYY